MVAYETTTLNEMLVRLEWWPKALREMQLDAKVSLSNACGWESVSVNESGELESTS